MTHPITLSQGATAMQGQLPHVQVDIRQPTGPRLETSQIPPYINPIKRPPQDPQIWMIVIGRDLRPNLITGPNIDF